LTTSYEAEIKQPDFVNKQSDSVRKLAVFYPQIGPFCPQAILSKKRLAGLP